MLTTDAPPPTPHQARNKDGDSAFVHVARLPPGSRLELAPYTSLYLAIPRYTSRYLPISPDISPHLPPGMRLEDAPASFFSGAALGPTGRFGSYAAPQASPHPGPQPGPNSNANPQPIQTVTPTLTLALTRTLSLTPAPNPVRRRSPRSAEAPSAALPPKAAPACSKGAVCGQRQPMPRPARPAYRAQGWRPACAISCRMRAERRQQEGPSPNPDPDPNPNPHLHPNPNPDQAGSAVASGASTWASTR